MAVYMVTYDLIGEPRRYETLFNFLSQFPNCRPLKSVWMIETPSTAIEVRQAARQFVDDNDKILVTRVFKDHWASLNMPTDCVTWMQSPQRQW